MKKKDKVVKKRKTIKKTSKFKKIWIIIYNFYLKVRIKVINIIAVLFLVSPQIVEILNVHSDLIKEEFGATYYITVLMLFSCINFYNTLNNVKEKMNKDEDKKDDKEENKEVKNEVVKEEVEVE